MCARYSYTNLIDTQLHSALRLISGCLQPTQLSWLPVLSNVASPSLCCKAATDNMLQVVEVHPNWPVYADVFEHPPPRLASRHPIWSDITSVDTITQWRQDWSSASVVNHTTEYSYRPYYPKARFQSPSSYMVSDEPFPDRSLVDMCTLTKFEGGLDLLHKVEDDAVIWLESTATAALAK